MKAVEIVNEIRLTEERVQAILQMPHLPSWEAETRVKANLSQLAKLIDSWMLTKGRTCS